MPGSFVLSTDSTADLPAAYLQRREISVLPYRYLMDGEEFTDDLRADPQALPAFYRRLRAGSLPSTSLVNQFRYTEYFSALLQQGNVLHVAFSSGLSGSYANAVLAARELREEFPKRRLIVIDSLAASLGHGLLVDLAADLRDGGASLTETAIWVKENRLRIHHQFFVSDLSYLHRSGRVSGPAAKIGSILNLCPLLHMDDKGQIIAYEKARGRKTAEKKMLDAIEAHAEGGTAYNGKLFLCHTDSPDEAEGFLAQTEERFPQLTGHIPVFDVGPVIACHTGPGLLGAVFVGDSRTAKFS